MNNHRFRRRIQVLPVRDEIFRSVCTQKCSLQKNTRGLLYISNSGTNDCAVFSALIRARPVRRSKEVSHELRQHQILRYLQRPRRPHQPVRLGLHPPLPRLLQRSGLGRCTRTKRSGATRATPSNSFWGRSPPAAGAKPPTPCCPCWTSWWTDLLCRRSTTSPCASGAAPTSGCWICPAPSPPANPSSGRTSPSFPPTPWTNLLF